MLSNLSKVIGDQSIPSSPSIIIVYYFSAYDCEPCVHKGFELLKDVKNKNIYSVKVVLSDGSVGEIRKKYQYNGFIFFDRDFLLNKQLNFTSTPVMIALDSTYRILCTYHPDSNYDHQKHEFNRYLHKLEEKMEL